MGQWLSRHGSPVGGDGGGLFGGGGSSDDPSLAYRYPPKNNAPFFASHFFMGGETFESPQPESFLFGDNADLNYLGTRPTAFPYPETTADEPMRTLHSHINIRRDSVHLKSSSSSAAAAVAATDDETVAIEKEYTVEFTFDADARCAVTLYYFCTEEVTPHGVLWHSRRPDLTSPTFEFGRGSSQKFQQSGHLFKPHKCQTELNALLAADGPDSDFIPLAIHCVSLEAGAGEPRQSHTTMAAFERQSGDAGGWMLKPLKQKLFVDGLHYLLQEIYGVENKAAESESADGAAGTAAPPAPFPDDDVDDCGAECVVCMCDLRDTIILPCRHLCLCNACANSLRYQASNCPICRAPFRALLQLRAVQKNGQVSVPPIVPGPDEDGDGAGGPLLPSPPANYTCVSLVEALNGPLTVPGGPMPAPVPPFMLGSAPTASGAEPKAKRKSRSGTKRSKATSSAGPSSSNASSSATPRSRDESEADAAARDDETPAKVETAAATLESPRKTSVLYVNETTAAEASAAQVTVGGAGAQALDDKRSVDGVASGAGGRGGLVDLVDEELAKMDERSSSVAAGDCDGDDDDDEDDDKEESSNLVEDVEDDDEDDVDDEAKVVNLGGRGASAGGSSSTTTTNTRASLPGTPTSLVSVRSSQDSASSASSTKQLLPSVSRASVSAPTSASSSASTVIVKVHPTTKDRPLEGGEEC